MHIYLREDYVKTSGAKVETCKEATQYVLRIQCSRSVHKCTAGGRSSRSTHAAGTNQIQVVVETASKGPGLVAVARQVD